MDISFFIVYTRNCINCNIQIDLTTYSSKLNDFVLLPISYAMIEIVVSQFTK